MCFTILKHVSFIKDVYGTKMCYPQSMAIHTPHYTEGLVESQTHKVNCNFFCFRVQNVFWELQHLLYNILYGINTNKRKFGKIYNF